MIDNANGGGVFLQRVTKQWIIRGSGQLISTFMQDLGLVTSIQPKAIDAGPLKLECLMTSGVFVFQASLRLGVSGTNTIFRWH